MARTDTLGNFLTDVAEAIRAKEGTTETIPASEFDTRISNLSGGDTKKHTELEYIGITGKTYYKLGTKLNSNSRVVAKFTRDLSLATGLFGHCNYGSSDVDSFSIYLGASSYNNGRMHGAYGSRDLYFSNTSTKIILDANKNVWSFANFNNEEFYKMTHQVETFESKFNCTVGASIWGASETDSLLYYKGNLYYFKVYDGDTLIHDLMPVEKNDGTVTLYDKVSKTYLVNLGTDEPSAGPSVQPESGDIKPTTDEEVKIAIENIIKARLEPIYKLPEAYDCYTTEPVTIYTPQEHFHNYIIRKRGTNQYAILWFNGGWIQFASTAANGDMYTKGVGFSTGSTTFTNADLLAENITFNTNATVVQQGLYSQSYSTLSEAIEALKSPDTTYTATNNSMWGNQSDDGGVYKICMTNIPAFDYYGEPLQCRRLSSNETIIEK